MEKVANLEKTVVEDEDEEEEEVAALVKGDANGESVDPESASPGKKIPYPKK